MFFIKIGLVLLGLSFAAGFLFKDDLKQWAGKTISEGRELALEKAMDNLQGQLPLSKSAREDILVVSKSVNPKILIKFLADPKVFITDKSPEALKLLQSADGKKLKALYDKHIK